MKALLGLLPLYAGQGRRLGLSLLLAAITLLSGVLLLGVSGWFLTATALTTAAAAFNLFGPSSLIRGLSLARILSRYGERVTGHDATLRLLADLRVWLFSRLFPRLPISDRSLVHGDLVSRLTADIDALDTVFLVAIGPFVTSILIATLMTTLLALAAPAAALVYAISMSLAIFAVPILLVLATRRTGREIVAASAGVRSQVLQGMEGHRDLVAFGQVERAQRLFARSLGGLGAARRTLGLRGAVAAATIQMLAGLSLVGVLWFGMEAYIRGAIDAPWLVGLVLATVASFEAANAIIRSVTRFSSAIAAAERVRNIADAPIAISEVESPSTLPEDKTLTIEALSFAHDGQAPMLRDIDLAIEPARHIAITGASGSGKSTLLGLLVRLHDPSSGTIRLGGTNTKALALADLRGSIALTTQESHVFLGTIRENLLIGKEHATDDDMWKALKDVRLKTHVRGLSGGLDAFVGELGATLSVGQARRLCMARALLSKAPILLFDEPTSGLDRDTEQALLKDLLKLADGRTLVLATHSKLPAGTDCTVYRLRNGRLDRISD